MIDLYLPPKPAIIIKQERQWRPLIGTLLVTPLIGFGANYATGGAYSNLIVPSATPSSNTGYSGEFTLCSVFESGQKLVASGGTAIRVTFTMQTAGANNTSVTAEVGNITDDGTTGTSTFAAVDSLTLGSSTFTTSGSDITGETASFVGLTSGKAFGIRLHSTWDNIRNSAGSGTTGNHAFHKSGSFMGSGNLSWAPTDITTSRTNPFVKLVEVFS